jgi:hypothetical protein
VLEWLVPLSAFWVLASLFLGGSPAVIQGGGALRQLLGLAASFALYLGLWWVARTGLGAATSAVSALVLASGLAAALIPWLCRLGFRAVGLRITGPTFGGGHTAHG